MKLFLAGLIAATSVFGAVGAADASVVKVVVKPGYPYYWHGAHYRYRTAGRYYNVKVKRCVMRYHRRVCTVHYR